MYELDSRKYATIATTKDDDRANSTCFYAHPHKIRAHQVIDVCLGHAKRVTDLYNDFRRALNLDARTHANKK